MSSNHNDGGKLTIKVRITAPNERGHAVGDVVNVDGDTAAEACREGWAVLVLRASRDDAERR